MERVSLGTAQGSAKTCHPVLWRLLTPCPIRPNPSAGTERCADSRHCAAEGTRTETVWLVGFFCGSVHFSSM